MSENSVSQKQCSKCGETKPLTPEYFHTHKTTKDGYRPDCRVCCNAVSNARYWSDPERSRKEKRDEYADDPNKFREKSRVFRAENPEVIQRQNKEYRISHHDEIRAAHLEWSHLNPDRVRGYRVKSRDKDIEHYRAIKRGDYYRHKPRYFHHSRLRRARLMNAEGTYTPDDIRRLFDEQEGMCAYCGIRLFWDIPSDIHIDHIQPLSRGGSNYPENLACACADCNLSKNDKLLSEWEQVRGW